MSINRRYFLKGIIGPCLFLLSPSLAAATLETVESRIQRLFAKCTLGTASEHCLDLVSLIRTQPLAIRVPDSELIIMSDKTFIEMLEKNIRQDFAEGQIIDLAGWQLASTEVAIMNIVGMGTAYHK